MTELPEEVMNLAINNAVDAASPNKTAEAKALLEIEKRERIERVQKAIAELLDKENCALDVSVIIGMGKVIPQIVIIAK